MRGERYLTRRAIKGGLLTSRMRKKLPPMTMAYAWLISMVNEQGGG